MTARVKKLNPHANTPAAVKMNEINPRYENTRNMHRLLTNQNPIKFETRKCSEVKDLTFVPSAVVFAKTYFTFLPSRAANRQIHSEYFNHCLTKQIEFS
jgi:hypothetical protein